jgi:hypothetical protein
VILRIVQLDVKHRPSRRITANCETGENDPIGSRDVQELHVWHGAVSNVAGPRQDAHSLSTRQFLDSDSIPRYRPGADCELSICNTKHYRFVTFHITPDAERRLQSATGDEGPGWLE